MSAVRVLLDTMRFRGGPAPAELAEAWTALDTRGLDKLVAFEGCGIWLYRRLRQLDVLQTIDPGFGEWLSSRAKNETARNLLIEAQAYELAEICERLDLPVVFLKGVARRLTADRYPMADARATNDVDILVPADRARELWYELRRLGYERTTPKGPPRPEHHHLPALWRDRQVGVEVHTTHAQGIPPAESWRRHFGQGMDVQRNGHRMRVPSATDLLWSGAAHGLRHPEIAFLLILLFDVAVIWASGEPIDWQEIARRLEAKEIVHGATAGAWFEAAAQLADVARPPELQYRLEPYNLERELSLRLAVLRRVSLPPLGMKALSWWSSEAARRI